MCIRDRLTNDVEIVRDSLFNTCLGLYTEILEFAIAVAAMFYLSPVLGTFAIFMAVSQLIVPLFFTKRISARGKAYADAQRNYMVILKENLSAFSICRLFHLEAEVNQRQSQYSKAKEDARVKSRSATALSYELSFAVGNAMFLGIYLLGAVLALKGYIRLSAIIAATQLMTYIASPLTTISEEIAELKSAEKVSEDLVTLLQQPETLQGTVHKTDVKCCLLYTSCTPKPGPWPFGGSVPHSSKCTGTACPPPDRIPGSDFAAAPALPPPAPQPPPQRHIPPAPDKFPSDTAAPPVRILSLIHI